MKTPLLIRKTAVLILTISLSFLYACSDDDTNNNDNLKDGTTDLTLIETDKEALLFMLEEEKLARDTYTPQFITQDEYNNIVEGSHEKCN